MCFGWWLIYDVRQQKGQFLAVIKKGNLMIRSFLGRVRKWLRMSGKLIHVCFQMIYGEWRISKLSHPMVSIFGSARLPMGQTFFIEAQQLAQRLAEDGINVVTGGGPGIMEAANCGVFKSEKELKGKTIGIGVRKLQEAPNPCVHEYFELDFFFARKWLLTHHSDAFIVFPGGFGTLDELAEVLTLMQTRKMRHVPIILIGVDFWEPLMVWIKEKALHMGLLAEKDVYLFTVTDDIELAYCAVRDHCTITMGKILKKEQKK